MNVVDGHEKKRMSPFLVLAGHYWPFNGVFVKEVHCGPTNDARRKVPFRDSDRYKRDSRLANQSGQAEQMPESRGKMSVF